ncbi:MAG TPA: hypothetical protein VMY42_16600 [Thermoguttaceae bacterium]|nr:hypothetical protein [Thermoguttaceae bacterium]
MEMNRFTHESTFWDLGWFTEAKTDELEEDSPTWTCDPSAVWLQVLDAFDLDGETTEPEPEYGDFWTETDEEQEI